jgi:hypothetical protein
MRMSEALFPDSPDTSAAAIVRDHAFEPRTERMRGRCACERGERAPLNCRCDWEDGTFSPYSLSPTAALCRHCRLAEAAHTR